MAANGRLASSALTQVQSDGAKLSTKTARAYKAMIKDHPQIRIAGPAGAYRSFAVQKSMHDASVGHNAAAKARWGLNPNSTVPLANAGYSSHGTGTRVDLVGLPLNEIISIARKYGFTLEFPGRDPNHFVHDGVTAVNPPKTVTRPGHIDFTLKTGKPNATFYKNLQWYARIKGGYTGPLDGKLGGQSYKGLQAALKHEGVYNGPIDGKYDPALKKALQTYAKRYGNYDGPLDGKLGVNSYIGLSRALNKL